MPPSLLERFQGSLLGLAVDDALGGRFEAQSADWIRSRYPTPQSLIEKLPDGELWYTDDTQMMIGVAETLVEHGEIDEELLCRTFVANYVPSRGYGRGTRVILEAIEEGRDHRQVVDRMFPGGSLGNGAAMRVAPVGLRFHDDVEVVRQQARLSSLPTHTHPLGIEGAQLLAVAVALAVRTERLDQEEFYGDLLRCAQTSEFQERLTQAARLTAADDLQRLGNGIKALDSVVTAIACFALHPDSYGQAIGNAILLGGDTDTIAAMTGALSGAYLGVRAIPDALLDFMEDQGKGRTYIRELATSLHAACSRRQGQTD